MAHYIRRFEELSIDDVALVGGKNASLGEMYRELTPLGVLVPNGFAVTAEAYKAVLDANGLWEKLHALLDDLDVDDVKMLQERAKACRALIYDATLPQALYDEIIDGYKALQKEYGNEVRLAVRSSATAEDSPEASFAGQNETYLNIRGERALIDAYKRCLASNFTERSLHYKHDHGFDFFSVYLSVTVMKMVRSDLAASGVMFSIDTETGFRDAVFINAAYGLGENVVQGSVDPDAFYVHKPTFAKGYRAVLKRRLGRKEVKMIFSDTLTQDNLAAEYTRNVATAPQERARFCISDEEVMILADYAIKIERHYSKKAGYDKPMDMEWAKDGTDGKLYMVQARPETVQSRRKGDRLEIYRLDARGNILVTGRAVGTKIGAGRVRIARSLEEVHDFREGEVLVADITTPDWEPIMKKAAAIVTNKGGRTCHAAIVSRELGLPAVVGAGNATEVLRDGMEVTVSCAEGESGYVYEGILPFHIETIDLGNLPRPKTEVMMNLGNPEQAFALASLPVDGIGLARMEFIINTYIKAHPMALLHPERTDEDTRKALSQLTQAFASPREFFIKTLSEGIATIAAAVYPKPCVVRMSDFKTNEYAALLGGRFFEPLEDNPMIGFRGAARYTHPAYEEGFALECAAIKRARETIGFDNIVVMIPFCRRVQEAQKVIETMARYGLKRGEKSLKIYMMCEIPNNVIQIDAFARYFDGISIGSNDLTQLVLGVDRDSETVAFDYDERDAGVMEMMRLAVEGARRNGMHSSICGQAPSDYPDVAEALVGWGIDAMSLNPDSVLSTLKRVVEAEKTL